MLVVFYFLPQLTYYIALYVKTLLPVENIEIIKRKFLFRDIYLISFPGKFPALHFSKSIAVYSFILMIILPLIKKVPKNLSIWICVATFITFISSIFFIFFPYKFPYTLTDFSELYLKTEIAIWTFFIPFIIVFFTLPLPDTFSQKFLLTASILSYGIIFGTVRYLIFLYILWRFSYLFMAPLYFIFGPLADFLYIVGIYCFYLSNLAIKLKRRQEIWVWT